MARNPANKHVADRTKYQIKTKSLDLIEKLVQVTTDVSMEDFINVASNASDDKLHQSTWPAASLAACVEVRALAQQHEGQVHQLTADFSVEDALDAASDAFDAVHGISRTGQSIHFQSPGVVTPNPDEQLVSQMPLFDPFSFDDCHLSVLAPVCWTTAHLDVEH